MSPPCASDPPPRKSILVVDDDECMREAIYGVLAPKYRVTLAVDGVDGYLRANERPAPDLIITDVSMPQLDGISMVRRIRETDALSRVPVIFLTGRMSPMKVIEGLSVGTFAFLAKPTDPDVLELNVNRALVH
jgi:DNA-binding response OmpR family regulator